MSLVEVFLLGVALSMDAFAVAVGKGLAMRRFKPSDALVIALFFGAFQALMPLLGYLLASAFVNAIEAVAPWVAFGLLALIGAKMIWDGFHDDAQSSDASASLGASSPSKAASGGSTSSETFVTNAAGDSDAGRLRYGELFVLAIATSIDALAVGVSFATLSMEIAGPAILIGVTTFVISFAGAWIGHRFGMGHQRVATIVGGVILIIIGLRVLLEHLGVWG